MSVSKYNYVLNACCAGARARIYSWVGKLWKKLKVLKARLGVYGDILVFALVWWSVQEYVPFGDLLTSVALYVFAGMFVFSVLYVAYAKVRQS